MWVEAAHVGEDGFVVLVALVGDFDGAVGVEDEGFVEPVHSFVMASAEEDTVFECVAAAFAPFTNVVHLGPSGRPVTSRVPAVTITSNHRPPDAESIRSNRQGRGTVHGQSKCRRRRNQRWLSRLAGTTGS